MARGVKTDPNNKVLIHERAKLVAELRLKGVPVKDISRALNLGERQVITISNYAADHGLIEQVRERLQAKLAPKIEKVYDAIMEAPASELAHKDVQKGHELKLKAARHLADGLGVFQKHTAPSGSVKGTLDLQQYQALLAERATPTTAEIVEALPAGHLSPSLEVEATSDAVTVVEPEQGDLDFVGQG